MASGQTPPDLIKAFVEAYLLKHAGNCALIEKLYKCAEEICKNKTLSRGVVFNEILKIVTENQSNFELVSNLEALEWWKGMSEKVMEALELQKKPVGVSSVSTINKNDHPIRGKPSMFSVKGQAWKSKVLGTMRVPGSSKKIAPKLLLSRDVWNNTHLQASSSKPLKRLQQTAWKPSSSGSLDESKVTSSAVQPTLNQHYPASTELSKNEKTPAFLTVQEKQLQNVALEPRFKGGASFATASTAINEEVVAPLQLPDGLSVTPVVGQKLKQLASSGNQALYRKVWHNMDALYGAVMGVPITSVLNESSVASTSFGNTSSNATQMDIRFSSSGGAVQGTSGGGGAMQETSGSGGAVQGTSGSGGTQLGFLGSGGAAQGTSGSGETQLGFSGGGGTQLGFSGSGAAQLGTCGSGCAQLEFSASGVGQFEIVGSGGAQFGFIGSGGNQFESTGSPNQMDEGFENFLMTMPIEVDTTNAVDHWISNNSNPTAPNKDAGNQNSSLFEDLPDFEDFEG